MLPRPLTAYVTNGWVLPMKSNLSVNVRMIIGAWTFQIGLPIGTMSYCAIEASGFAIAGRVTVLLAEVAGNCGVVAFGIRFGSFDPIHVAIDDLVDDPGEHLGVSDLQSMRPP